MATRLTRQQFALGAAGALVVAAVVLLIVALAGGGTDGPAPGSPEAVTDSLAAALNSGSAAGVRAVTCVPARRPVLRALHGDLGSVHNAARSGQVRTQGRVGVSRLTLRVAGSAKTATVALAKSGSGWCVRIVVVS